MTHDLDALEHDNQDPGINYNAITERVGEMARQGAEPIFYVCAARDALYGGHIKLRQAEAEALEALQVRFAIADVSLANWHVSTTRPGKKSYEATCFAIKEVA